MRLICQPTVPRKCSRPDRCAFPRPGRRAGIEAGAKRRLANEYDAAQERGEVSTGRDGPGAGVLNGNA